MAGARTGVEPLRRRSLYERIRFDCDLETEALNRISSGEFDVAERLLSRLVRRLDMSESVEAGTVARELLLDLLQSINRRLFPPLTRTMEYRSTRAELIEEFSQPLDPREARRRLIPTFKRLIRRREAGDGNRHPLVRRAIEQIQQQYQGRLYLSDVATELGVSPNYLSRLFRRETGQTLTAFIQHVRLEHAKRLLVQGNQTLAEIAYQVGYQNYRDFYRNFVKLEKASPREVQRRLHSVRSAEVRSAEPIA